MFKPLKWTPILVDETEIVSAHIAARSIEERDEILLQIRTNHPTWNARFDTSVSTGRLSV